MLSKTAILFATNVLLNCMTITNKNFRNMKREIRFRGLRIDRKGWEYGHYTYDVQYPESHATHTINGWEIDPETVGQFTGLLDKKGVEIFEGDIIAAPHFGNLIIGYSPDKAALVGSGTMDFSLKLIHNFADDIVMSEGWEVIGNIYEQSQLLAQ
jgi:uncharacterized phage protein (TIGR01671 family)